MHDHFVVLEEDQLAVRIFGEAAPEVGEQAQRPLGRSGLNDEVSRETTAGMSVAVGVEVGRRWGGQARPSSDFTTSPRSPAWQLARRTRRRPGIASATRRAVLWLHPPSPPRTGLRGLRPWLLRDPPAEGFCTDKCVQIVVAGGGHHAAVAGHGGQNSGLELTGVGDDEHVARIGDDARAHGLRNLEGPAASTRPPAGHDTTRNVDRTESISPAPNCPSTATRWCCTAWRVRDDEGVAAQPDDRSPAETTCASTEVRCPDDRTPR